MKNSKRFFMVAAFLTACFVFTGLNAPTVKAVTLDELQAQIDALMAQITNLQQEKAQLQTGNGSDGTGETWCHTFNVRLKYGDTGSEVHALRTALRKEGFDVPPVFSNYITTKFEKYTSAAVVGFQEKYRADILAPYNISHGTGYVGPTTLAKLNELYRCSTKKGTISITPVNVFQGKTYSFSGKVMGAEPNSMVHFYLKSSKGNMLENGKYVGTTNSSGYFSTNRNQKIYSLAPIGIYDAWVVINGQKSNIVTLTVSASTDCHTTAPWDWEYCTPECPCDAGEGDCDSDADCTTGYCHNNVGANYGKTSSMDVCEHKSTTIIPTCTDTDPNDVLITGFGTSKVKIYGGSKVYGIRPDGTSYTTYDSCNGSNTQVNGMWCYDNPNGPGKVAGKKVIDCEYGCSNSTCKRGITVTSPTYKKQLQAGSIFRIEWSSAGFRILDIVLTKGGSTHAIVAKSIDASKGYYDWKIPTNNMASGDDYSLRFSVMNSEAPSADIINSLVKETPLFTITAASTSCHTTAPWSWEYCTPECPCDAGEGDCDTDTDCTTGYCHNNVGANYGKDASMDVCEKKEATIPSMVVRLDASTPSSQNLQNGQTDVTLSKIKIIATNGDVPISGISLGIKPKSSMGLVKNIKVYDGSVLIGSLNSFSTLYAENFDYAWGSVSSSIIVPNNTYKVLTLKGDIASTGLGSFQVGIVGFKHGLNSINSNNFGSIFGNTMSVNPLSMAVSLDMSTPANQNLIAGQIATFAKIELINSSAADISNMNRIQIASDSSINPSSYLTDIKIYDGSKQIGKVAGDLVYNGSYYYAWVNVSDVSIPGYSSKTLTIKADIKSYVPGGFVRLGIAGFNFDSPGCAVSGTPMYGNNMTIISSAPQRSISVLSPNGGEQLIIGKTYDIAWDYSGINEIGIYLLDFYGIGEEILINRFVPASSNVYSWIVTNNIVASNEYKIELRGYYGSNPNEYISDKSNGYFTISEPATGCDARNISVWDWNYCTSECPCSAGEGDCDSDADCTTGYCHNNVGANYGQTSSMDVCEEKEETPYVAIISPNGNEKLIIGESYNITWKSKGVDEVNIRVVDSRGIDSTLARNINALEGKYLWATVGSLPSSYTSLSPGEYKIEIINSNPYLSDPSDQSNNYFSIVAGKTICTDSDGGPKVICEKGTVKLNGESKTDYCTSSNVVREYFCKTAEGVIGYTDRSCRYGCQDGACKPGVTINSPKEGEKLETGQTYEIIWTPECVYDLDKLSIKLVKVVEGTGGYQEHFDVVTIASMGDVRVTPIYSYAWKIPENIPVDDYKIQFFYDCLEDYELLGTSELFTITQAVTGCDARNISVWDWIYCTPECPCDAGEGDCDTDADCATGYCHNNVGANYGQNTSMDVCEHKSTTIIPTCTDSDNGCDTFIKGKVYGIRPSGLKYEAYDSCNGSKTQVYEMSCYDNPYGQGKVSGVDTFDCEYGCSDGACKPGITVASPNGGETWESKTVNTINWKFSSDISTVDIILSECTLSPCVNSFIAKNIPNDGDYFWSVGDLISGGGLAGIVDIGKYKISVRNSANVSVSDESDSYFSITSETGTTCTDSDDGKNYFVKGTTKGLTGNNLTETRTDYCSGDKVVEWFCSGQYRTNTYYTCPLGCSDGACIGRCPDINNDDIVNYLDLAILADNMDKCSITHYGFNDSADLTGDGCVDKTDLEYLQRLDHWLKNRSSIPICPSLPDQIACTDLDGGKDYYTKRKATGLYGSNQQKGWVFGENSNKSSARYDSSLNYSIYYDHCVDSQTSNQLNEGYCDSNGILHSTGYQCPNGCSDGACIKATGLNDMEKQLASASDAISQIIENLKKLMNK